MNIASTPKQYQSAFEDAVYTIEGVDPQVVTDVEVLNGKDGRVLGIKRFKGMKNVTVNVAGYVRRLFDVKPVGGGSTGLIGVEGRLNKVYVKSGQVTSGVCCMTYGTRGANPCSLLSAMPQNVALSWDETAELAFIADGHSAVASLIFEGISTEASVAVGSISPSQEMVTLVIDMAEMRTRLVEKGAQNIDGFTRMKVMVEFANGTSVGHRFRIVPKRKSRVRLCWLNRYGAVDYYSMAEESGREVVSQKNRVYAEGGYRISKSYSESKSALVSEYENYATLEWLSEIITSPYVWVVKDGEFEAVDVVTQNVTVKKQNQPSRLELEIRPVKKNHAQKS